MTIFAKRPSFHTVVQLAEENANAQVWPKVTGKVDPSGLSCRDLFTYALILCEANRHLKRIPVLLKRAQQMQNLNEESETYGNFWWGWGQGSVLDPNAVEFAMRSGTLLWLRHKDKLGKGKRILKAMLEPAASACRHHASMPLYTNIALMNAMNLMLLGQATNRKSLIRMGEDRFEQFCLYTWDWGIHEFCSPTYTPIQIACLGMIERFSSSDRIRKQASVMLNLFWANVAANWLDKAAYLGGTYSRNSGFFLEGDINILELLWANGVWPLDASSLSPLVEPTLNVIFQGLSHWDATPVFRRVYDIPYPRNLKQRWGPLQNQTRTFFQFEDVALSVTGAQYDYPNWQDVTLAANFNVPVLAQGSSKPKIDTPGKLIFVPDAKAKGADVKYSHYSPRLWTAAQQKQDALGLVLFRLVDLETLGGLELNLMMSSWPGEIWVGDQMFSQTEASLALLQDQPVIFRHLGVAIGVRVVWQNGGSEPVLKQDPHGDENAWLLNIDLTLLRGASQESDPQALPYVGAAFWTRVGEGLEKEEDFQAWRQRFASDDTSALTLSSTGCDLTIAAAGEAGTLQIRAISPDLTHFDVLLEPEESFSLFDVDGRDLGRELLKTMPLVEEYLHMLANLPAVPVPGPLERDMGYTQFPMSHGYNIPDEPYFWVSPDDGDENGGSDTGSVTWRLSVPEAGRYYLYADVWPCPSDNIVQIYGTGGLPIRKEDQGSNALLLRVYQDIEKPIAVGTSLISCKDTTQWQCLPLGVNLPTPPEEPMLLGLPKGDVFVQLFSHTSGLKIQRLYVTDEVTAKPE
ncbi:MAG: hypothetical protein ACI8V2_002931 [Candidatus Latescibacterota bacterium]|jgi:hypothetical protein